MAEAAPVSSAVPPFHLAIPVHDLEAGEVHWVLVSISALLHTSLLLA